MSMPPRGLIDMSIAGSELNPKVKTPTHGRLSHSSRPNLAKEDQCQSPACLQGAGLSLEGSGEIGWEILGLSCPSM